MTVASTTSRVSYSGNGSTTAFTVPFYFLANSHLQVIKRAATGIETTLVLTADYSVSGAGNPAGGSITCVVAPATGEKLVVLRNVPFTQEVDYQSNDPFPAQTHEQALDKLTMELQQINEVVSRAVTVPAGDTTAPNELINEIVSYNASSAASAASALSSLNTFKGTYYGAYASDPATDPLGNLPGAGDLYTNTATGMLRLYTGSAWVDSAQATPVSYNAQLFNGTGAQTVFTLSSAPASLLATEVFISGVRQRSATDYAVSGTTLTFTTAPASGTNNIFVRWTNAIAVGVPNDGSVTTAKLQDASVTTAKLQDASVTTAKLQDASVTTAKLAQKLTQGVAVNTTSGTAIDFTGIPSWVKRITVMLNGVSTSGTSPLQIQVGSGSIDTTTSYVGTNSAIGMGGASTTMSSGFLMTLSTSYNSAADVRSGSLTLVNLGSNIWIVNGLINATGSTYSYLFSGAKTLSGVLDRIRLTTVNGTDTFDAGSVNILYEG